MRDYATATMIAFFATTRTTWTTTTALAWTTSRKTRATTRATATSHLSPAFPWVSEQKNKNKCSISSLVLVEATSSASSFTQDDVVDVWEHNDRKQAQEPQRQRQQRRLESVAPNHYYNNNNKKKTLISDSASAGTATSFSSSSMSKSDIDLETYRVNLEIAKLAEQCTREKNVSAAVHAIRLLRSLSHPDSVAYNSVLKTLAKISPARIPYYHQHSHPQQQQPPPQNNAGAVAGGTHVAQVVAESSADAAHVAQELWHEMVHLHRQQVQANQAWYQDLADGLLTEEQLEQGAPRVRVKANCRTVSTVMDAWGRKGDWESAQKCERLLQQLQTEYDETGDVALQPNLITYNILLNAYAKCGGPLAGQKCLDIVHHMRNTFRLEPDIISHNAVLHALARSGSEAAGERTEAYLREIILLNTKGGSGTGSGMDALHVPPNGRSYTTCMDAWSRLGRPDRAHALLQEMERLYEQAKWRHDNDNDRDKKHDDRDIGSHRTTTTTTTNRKNNNNNNNPYVLSLAPNVITYSTVIHAYATSELKNKAMKAYDLYQDMLRNGIMPNTYTMNGLLNACASTRRPTAQVLDIFRTVYRDMVDQGQADQYTFGTVLKAAARSNEFFCSIDDDDDEDEASSSSSAKEFATQVFREACRCGKVSQGVWDQLRFALPSNDLNRLLLQHRHHHHTTTTTMPTSMTENSNNNSDDNDNSLLILSYEEAVPYIWRAHVRESASSRKGGRRRPQSNTNHSHEKNVARTGNSIS